MSANFLPTTKKTENSHNRGRPAASCVALQNPRKAQKLGILGVSESGVESEDENRRSVFEAVRLKLTPSCCLIMTFPSPEQPEGLKFPH